MSPLRFSISTKEFFSDPAISPVVGGSSCGLCASSPPPPPFFLNKSTPQTCKRNPQHQLHSHSSLDSNKQGHIFA